MRNLFRFSFFPAVPELHKDRKFVIGKSSSVFFIKAIGSFLSLGAQIILARMLGINEYGIYSYVLSWIMISAVFSRAGMDMILVKYIPIYKAGGETGRMRAVLLTSFISLCIVYVTYAAILFAGRHTLVNPVLLGGDRFPLVISSMILAFLLPFSQILQSGLRGLKLVVLPEILDNIFRPVMLITLFLACRAIFASEGQQDSTFAAMTAFCIAVFLGIIIAGHRFFKSSGLPPSERLDYSDARKWFGLALPMMLMAGMNDLMSRTDVLMVGNMLTPAQAGVYSVASKFAEFSLFGVSTASAVLSPLISELYHTEQKDRLQDILTTSAWLTSAITMVILLCLAVAGPLVLPLFGKGFNVGYMPMLILLVGQIFDALTGPIGVVTILTGHQHEAIKVLIFKGIANFIGNWLLIPRYGIEGSAIATACTIAVTNLWLFFYIRKTTNLNCSVFSLRASHEK